MGNTLPGGYGMPGVEVTLRNGKPLVQGRTGRLLSKEIVEFEYCYDEEGDDDGKIVFMDLNGSTMADHSALTPDTLLTVRWGYIGHEKNWAKRLVVVRDVEVDYSETGVKITLILTNYASYLRGCKSKEIVKGDIKSFLTEMTATRKDVNLKWNGQYVMPSLRVGNVSQYGDKQPGFGRGGILNYAPMRGNIFFCYSNRSPMQALRQVLDEVPEGPWLIDGRDDDLDIHTRDFNQSYKRIYTYAGEKGDVISFSPRTNHQEQDATMAVESKLDADEKTINQASQYYSEEGAGGGPGGPTNDTNFAGGNSNTQGDLAYQYKRYFQLLKDIQTENDTRRATHREDLLAIPAFTVEFQTQGTGYYDLQGSVPVWIPATESTAVVVKADIPAQTVITSPDGLEALEELFGNTAREASQKTISAGLTVIGDPILQSSQMISMQHVAKCHKGGWYIVKATHTINVNEGYKTTMELIKSIAVGTKSTVQEVLTEVGIVKEGEVDVGNLTMKEFEAILLYGNLTPEEKAAADERAKAAEESYIMSPEQDAAMEKYIKAQKGSKRDTVHFTDDEDIPEKQ